MYSEQLQELFKKKKIEIGDRVKVTSEKGEFEGLLMPRPESGDNEILVLKLDTGYNIGIKPMNLELILKAKPLKASGGSQSSNKENKEKEEKQQIEGEEGEVAIIGCGGTIASKIEYKTGAVYPSITPQELKASFPELSCWNVHSKKLFSLFSEDLNIHHWKLLAHEIEQEIKKGSQGIVIMHGTDTLSYTSAAMSFALQNLPVPVVFVGSQRSSDRPSSENKMNLLNAVFASTQNFGEVTLCMHATSSDDYCHIHRGTRVRKMHTSRRDAFRSINSKPLFISDYHSGRFEELSPNKPRSSMKEFTTSSGFSDNVTMIYFHPGLKAEFISRLSDYDGLVILGTGLGHVSANPFEDKTVKSIYQPLKDLINSGVSVVMAPQTIYGRICMRVYTTGRMLVEAGVIGDGADWTPEAAYAKLCWALGQTKDKNPKKVRELMMKNIAGEITARSGIEDEIE